LHASTPFVRKRGDPDGGIGAAEKGVDVFGLAGFGVVNLAANGSVEWDRRDKMNGLKKVALVSAAVEMGTGETGARTLAGREG
jgi:hypothetical protein